MGYKRITYIEYINKILISIDSNRTQLCRNKIEGVLMWNGIYIGYAWAIICE